MNPKPVNELLMPFFKKTMLLALIFLIVYFAISAFFEKHIFSLATPWLILFFLVVYNYLYYRHLQALQKRSGKFVNNFILSSGFKLIVFLFIILGYSMLFRDDAINFIITFFILYLIFTSIELLHIKGSVE